MVCKFLWSSLAAMQLHAGRRSLRLFLKVTVKRCHMRIYLLLRSLRHKMFPIYSLRRSIAPQAPTPSRPHIQYASNPLKRHQNTRQRLHRRWQNLARWQRKPIRSLVPKLIRVAVRRVTHGIDVVDTGSSRSIQCAARPSDGVGSARDAGDGRPSGCGERGQGGVVFSSSGAVVAICWEVSVVSYECMQEDPWTGCREVNVNVTYPRECIVRKSGNQCTD